MEFVEVFSSPNPGAIAVAKSVLDSEGIENTVPNEAQVNIFGVGELGSIEIQVPKDQAKKARELLNNTSGLEK